MEILIVEDDASIRELIKLHLLKFKESFYSLNIYESGNIKGGKEEYELREPDMVILDCSLPDSEAEETIKIIPSFSAKSAVVVLTNHEKIEFVIQAMKFGAQDYLTKQVLNDGKTFSQKLLAAWSSFAQERMKQTGSFPDQRVKQIGQELLAVTEKHINSEELRNLIQFTHYARGHFEDMQKKVGKLHTAVFEGNGTPSMRQDIASLKDDISDLEKRLEESLGLRKKTKEEVAKTRWGIISVIITGLAGLLGAIGKLIIDNWSALFFKGHGTP